jgi:hypothetical protein
LTEAAEAPQLDVRDRLQGALGPCDRAVELSSSAAERLAFLVQRAQGERPAVEVVLGGDLRVRLTQAEQGIELSIQGEDRPLQAIQASVPGILEALQRYGVRVTRVQVRGDVLGQGRKSSGSRPAFSR